MKRALVLSALVCVVALAAAQQQTEFADQVIVWKSERRLELLRAGKVLKTYKVALGGAPVGAKTQQGDQKTPEGSYVIDFRNPRSQFYKSLHISYPNVTDRERARRLRVAPGGDIFLHGLGAGSSVGKSHVESDWTLGCIAVTNEEIDEIWKLVRNGTRIEIKP